MLINSNDFVIDKLLLLFYIAWLLQLKKIPNNQIRITENILNEEEKKTGLDNFSFVTPLLLHFCCPYLDELHKLLTRFSTGVKKVGQKIKDVSHLFSFDLVRDTAHIIPNPRQIQLKLMSQFLFLHPNCKRIVDFNSEQAVINFVKYFRPNVLGKCLTELNAAYYALNLTEADLESTETEAKLLSMAQESSKLTQELCLESGKK